MEWLWNALYSYSQIFNIRAAQAWYAQHSATNWQAGGFGRVMAVFQDAAGGYVSSWAGSPVTAAQGWWSLGFSIPECLIGGGQLYRLVNSYQAIGRSLFASADAFAGVRQINLQDAAIQMWGFSGDLFGRYAEQVPLQIFPPNTGAQYTFGFGSSSALRFTERLQNISNVMESSGYGAEIGKLITEGGGLSSVGGVLFENCASVLTDIGEIKGAYWDPGTQSLVFLGSDGSKEKLNELKLPAMDRDHLAVALRAALAGQPVGVSIDPPPQYRENMMSGAVPPDNTPMLVSYLGNTEHTLFGAIMFEADRLLKCLTTGVDNITGQPVRAGVPGFRPLLEMVRPGDGRRENVWRRFWFVIDRVELKYDSSTGGIAFGDVRLKLLSETELHGQPADRYASPADDAFIKHLTEHYDEYAGDFPVLARLKELAKIAAVAKFLVNQGIPLDMDALFSSPPAPVDTPASTPGISVISPNVEVCHQGNTVQTRSVSLFGGVDMNAEPHFLPDDGSARRLKTIAEQTRPAQSASSWTFNHNGFTGRALAARIGRPQAPVRRICNDYEFPSNAGGYPVRLRRIYNSTSARWGEFGPGWSLWVPFSLDILCPGAKRPEVRTGRDKAGDVAPVLVLHDYTTWKTDIYRSVAGNTTGKPEQFCRVVSQRSEKVALSISYDPSDGISGDQDGFMLIRADLCYCFDSGGRLLEVRRGALCLVRYVWENGKIVRVADCSDHYCDISYEPSGRRRVTEITTGAGARLSYLYDPAGFLITCRGSKTGEFYSYDFEGRLTEIKTASGRIISRNVYNDLNESANNPFDIIVSGSGSKIKRSFDRDRVASLQDESGVLQQMQYGGNGELAEIQIKDRAGVMGRLEYDSAGRLCGYQDIFSRTIRLLYDEKGKVSRYIGHRGNQHSFQVGDSGRLQSITDQDKNEWTFNYDNNGNVRRINGPAKMQYNYKYERGSLVKISEPAGKFEVRSRQDILELKTVTSSGSRQELIWDSSGRIKQYRVRDARPVRFNYDEGGRSFDIITEAGNIGYNLSKDDLTVTVSFQDS